MRVPEGDAAPPAGARRAYLKGITVEGFRGIGPKITLTLQPGPGLAVVTGRNGPASQPSPKRSSQLRVRAALTLALGCGVLAYQFGFASILGAFAAGLLVRLVRGLRPRAE